MSSAYQLGFECGQGDLKNYGFGSDILACVNSLLPEYRLPLDQWMEFAVGYANGSEMKAGVRAAELKKVERFVEKHTRRASMSIKDLLKLNQQFLDLVKQADSRCNCENLACERAGRHGSGGCTHLAGKHRVKYLGKVCDECFKAYPKEYQVTEKEHELPWLTRNNKGKLIEDPTAPTIEHRFGPDDEELIAKKPPHLFENPFQEQVDMDVDQISPDDISSDSPFNQEEEEEDEYNPDENIYLAPHHREKNIEMRKKYGPLWQSRDPEDD